MDTGAEFSILPASPEDKKRHSLTEALEAANGSPVPVFGRRTLTLTFGSGRHFTHSFLLADVTKPLLGVDFFNSFNIGVDTKGRRLFDLSSGTWFGGEDANDNSSTICQVGYFGDRFSFSELLDEFPEITSPSFTNKKSVMASHTMSPPFVLLCVLVRVG